MKVKSFNFILYVKNQDASTEFYKKLLKQDPVLFVPGMTEFRLSDGCTLGLMPEAGIKRLLGNAISDPEKSNGIARAELYFTVEAPQDYLQRALDLGGTMLSKLEPRNWGDRAGYIADLDGHVVAFAEKN